MYKAFSNLRLSDFPRKDEKNIGFESCTKTKVLIETLTEEILTVAALMETKLENRNESDQYSFCGQSDPACFHCMQLNEL